MSQREPDILNTAEPGHADWRTVLVTIAAGLVAALQVGKAPPALYLLGADLSASLPVQGWIASMLALVGASCAVLLGLFAQRVDVRRLIATSLTIIAAGSLLGALAQSAGWLVLTRALEGIGLVAIAVSAPRLVAANAGGQREFAMGLWSAYMPFGMSIGVASAALLLIVTDWRAVWLFNAALAFGFAILFLVVTRRARKPTPAEVGNWRRPLSRVGPWLLGVVFGCYALCWMALMTWLPDFAAGTLGLTRTAAAWFTALVVISNVIGNVGAAFLIDRGVRRVQLILCAFAAIAVTGPALMLLDPGPGIAITLALIFSILGGLLPGAVFSATPAHAPTPSDISPVNGIVVQLSQLGQLAGAPLLGWLVAAYGSYRPTAWVFAGMALAGGVAAMAAGRAARRISATG